MNETLGQYYLWLKAIHLVSLISWMAGMFYLPRLFVYHTQVEAGSQASETFKVMERKLLRIIMNPAMIATFTTGILLIIATGAGGPGTGSWMHIKLVLVLLMAGIHGMLSRCRKDFEKDANSRSEKFYRILNEGPTILMIAIVFLVVFKAC
jgi:protoporphyrinogen IX oxidase